MSGYEDKPPFDSSLMVHFRKHLTPETIHKVNELVIAKGLEKASKVKDDDKNDPPRNSGPMIVDVTCAPSNIKYPQDT